MNEFDVIRRYFSRASTAVGVALGVGDDGAVLVPEAGRDLVVVVDTLVEGVHFPTGMDAADVGFRAVAVNLSDMAAMAARPRWMTLALTLPHADADWLERFANGLYAAAEAAGVALVGGDTTRGEQTVITIQIIGDTGHGQRLARSGAAPGDVVFVSGTLGDAAAGLRLLQTDSPPDANDDCHYLLKRFARPSARIGLGGALAGVASAAIDVSDGLHADLGRLLSASGVSAVLDTDRVPLSAALQRVFPQDASRFALAGGDDYELCFTVPPERAERVTAISSQLGIALTQIGRIEAGDGLRYEGSYSPDADELRGFDHFHGPA